MIVSSLCGAPVLTSSRRNTRCACVLVFARTRVFGLFRGEQGRGKTTVPPHFVYQKNTGHSVYTEDSKGPCFWIFDLLCTFLLLAYAFDHSLFTAYHSRCEGTTTARPTLFELESANDTLVVLRTGSTEIDDRILVHLSTSLRCFSQYLIFSDLEEQYHDEHVLDALSSVSDDIKASHEDFEIYRRLQHHGRAILEPSELSGSPEAFEQINGNVQNPGWKLDKCKFMPMINRTMHEHPDKKWYVFIEADTFLLWSMLLQYLSLLDPTNPYYMGAGTCLGEHLFAHGSSGFVVSQPAMRLVTQHYTEHKAEIEALTEREWAGDYILGKTFNDAGVPCTDAWPHFQGDYPGLVAYAGPDGRYGPAASLREWCVPTISYHHMSSGMIRGLWDFEQQWMTAHENKSDVLTHGDVFKEYVLPQMMAGDRADWDNLSDKDEVGVSSLDNCRARCEAQSECKQYSFVQDTQQCRTPVNPRLGKQSNGTQSGWIEDRVFNFAHNSAACEDEGWQVGQTTRHTKCR